MNWAMLAMRFYKSPDLMDKFGGFIVHRAMAWELKKDFCFVRGGDAVKSFVHKSGWNHEVIFSPQKETGDGDLIQLVCEAEEINFIEQ